MEWRWALEEENEMEENGDEEEGSENGPKESQKEGTLSSAFC